MNEYRWQNYAGFGGLLFKLLSNLNTGRAELSTGGLLARDLPEKSDQITRSRTGRYGRQRITKPLRYH
jgi:hypothetical protein